MLRDARKNKTIFGLPGSNKNNHHFQRIHSSPCRHGKKLRNWG